MKSLTRFKTWLHHWKIYNKCPVCGSKLTKSYLFDTCSKCKFGDNDGKK
jgi:hypothetical protein